MLQPLIVKCFVQMQCTIGDLINVKWCRFFYKYTAVKDPAHKCYSKHAPIESVKA